MPSRLIVVPAKQQVSKSGGTTRHRLVCVGNQRLAFKIKLKAKCFQWYSISPVIGFIQPSTARDILVTRQPGKVGRDRIMVQYMIAPSGYDPRNPFIKGAEIGHVTFQVIAVDGEPKNGPETAAKGKIVSKIGQQWYKKVSKEEDERLEKRIADLFYPTEEQIRMVVRKKSSQLSWHTNSSTSATTTKKSKAKLKKDSKITEKRKDKKESKEGKRKKKTPEGKSKGKKQGRIYGTELLDAMEMQQLSDDDDQKESKMDEGKDEREPSERKGVEVKGNEENEGVQTTAVEVLENLPSEEDNADDEDEYVSGKGVQQIRSQGVLKQKKGSSHPQQLPAEPSPSGTTSRGTQQVKCKEVDHYVEEQYLWGRNTGGAEEYIVLAPKGATSSTKNNDSGQSGGNKNNNDRGQSNGSGSNVGAKDAAPPRTNPTTSSYIFL